MNIEINLINELAKIPTKSREDDAGYDLYATEEVVIKPMERKLVKTGITLSIPTGFYAHISDRSGMALKRGAHCLGKIVDPSFRGEIGVILYNTDMYEPIKISISDRIAQVIFKKYENIDFVICDKLNNSTRQDLGYGSSGE
jgi:dUTP pyrophosphatase